MRGLISVENIEKIYHRGAEKVHALKGVTLQFNQPAFVAIVGPTGSGKTTLLQIIGCLDRASSGVVRINGTPLNSISERAIVQLRREKIGFVFQQFFLIPELTVKENVALPLLFSRKKVDDDHIMSLLHMVDITDRAEHLPNQLSGGEMQRVAIARALANDPEVILADEPTGNLDTKTSKKIFRVFETLYLQGLTVIVVTHNEDLAKNCKRVIELVDGNIIKDETK
ncbi:MAG: ABC transporter ATP-binding protein [Nitrospirae bacterium]|nr:ABC transporter ATP-binding protein [Nitrospirota bacterium]